MKISVIIPTYNREAFIIRAVNSVLNQSIKVDEIIVVDDGSSDNTKEVLKSSKIRYIKQENLGVSAARNTGIKAAKYEYIAFLDSDDTWHNNKISEHINYHKKNPEVKASYTKEVWIRNNKIISLKKYQEKEEPTFINSLSLCKIGTSTFFSHKSIFDELGFFDENLKVCEDYDLWLRILLNNKIKLIDLELTNKYAGHEEQLSFSTRLIDTYRIKALEKHLKSKFQNEVLEELITKITILLKGAKKHNNIEILNLFTNKLVKYNKLLEN
jgi:glycosyltransferase involved in cell wall biosynthesis